MARAEYENYMSTPLAYATPEQVQAAYMAALNEQTKSPAEGVPIKSWTQGVSSMIDALAGTKRMNDVFGYQKQQQLAPNRLLFPGGTPGAGNGAPQPPSAAAPSAAGPSFARASPSMPTPAPPTTAPLGGSMGQDAADSVAGNAQPARMAAADMQSMIGQTMHNPQQRAMLMDYMNTGGVNLTREQRAWCADFVNAARAQHGLTTGNPMASSLANVGPHVQPGNERVGDVAVWPRGNHTGVISGVGLDGNLRVVSGNTVNGGQNSSVGEQTYPPGRLNIYGGNVPAGGQPPAQPPVSSIAPSGSTSTPTQLAGPLPSNDTGDTAMQTPQPQQMAEAQQQRTSQPQPQFYPPTQQPIFTDEQIYNATRVPNWQSNPALKGMVDTWMAQKVPQQLKLPDGTILYGNPFIGYRASGIYEKPDVMNQSIESGGSKIPLQTIPGRDAQGNPVQQQYPIVPAPGSQPQNAAPAGVPGQTGASAPGPQSAVEPFPFNGTPQQMIEWGQRNAVREAGAKKGAETQAESDVKYSDKVYQGLMGTSMIAAQQKVNLKLAKEIVDDPSFVSGFAQKFTLEQQRALARVGIDPGAAAPREVMEQLFARILADQFSGIRALAAESGEQGGRIFQSMLTVEEKAMPSADDTPAGIRAKINILDKVGDLMMQFAKEAAQYKKENGRLDPAFETHLHDLIAKAEIPWGTVKSSPGKATEKPKTEPGSFKYDAQGKRIP